MLKNKKKTKRSQNMTLICIFNNVQDCFSCIYAISKMRNILSQSDADKTPTNWRQAVGIQDYPCLTTASYWVQLQTETIQFLSRRLVPEPKPCIEVGLTIEPVPLNFAHQLSGIKAPSPPESWHSMSQLLVLVAGVQSTRVYTSGHCRAHSAPDP